VQLIKPAHERQVGRRYRRRSVVQARAAQIEQFALAHDRHIALPIDQRFALVRPKRPSAPDKKSRSMVSSPTLARRSRICRSASSSAGYRFEYFAGVLKQLLAPGGDLGDMHAVARGELGKRGIAA